MEEKDIQEQTPLNSSLADPQKKPSDFLIEIPQSDSDAPKSHQFRALFRKAVTLQLRQKANSIIQVFLYNKMNR